MAFPMRLLVISLMLLCSSCATTNLWLSGNNEYVEIIPTTPDEDVEAALKDSGRGYFCQQLYASSHPNNKVCYATLTKEDKLRNIEIKLRKTPKTLVTDAGNTIKVVGYVAIDLLMHLNIHKG